MSLITDGRWIVPFLWACAGCSQYRAATVEHHVRYDPRTDTALWLVIGSGVQAREDTARSRGDARRALAAMTERRTALAPNMLWAPILEFDVDLSLEEKIELAIEASSESEQPYAAFAPVTVLDKGLFRHEGRLHYYRLVQVSDVTERLRAQNDLWNQLVLGWFEHAAVRGVDAPTMGLWHDKARRGSDWFVIADEEFVVSVPLPPSSLLATLDELERSAARGALAFLESTSFAAGHWIVRFRLPMEEPLSIALGPGGWQARLEPSMPAEPRGLDSVRALIRR